MTLKKTHSKGSQVESLNQTWDQGRLGKDGVNSFLLCHFSNINGVIVPQYHLPHISVTLTVKFKYVQGCFKAKH